MSVSLLKLQECLDELAFDKIININLKDRIKYIENKVKCNAKI